MNKRNPGKLIETRSRLATIRRVFELADASGMSYREIAAKMGVHNVTISKWKHGKETPSVQYVEEMLQVLGYRLEVVPL